MHPDSLHGHEEHRWSYMTEEKLARRLKRITRPEKLDCFIEMALQKKEIYLYELAIERQVDLGFITKAKEEDPNGGAKIKAEVKEKWEKVKEQEIDERFVDF